MSNSIEQQMAEFIKKIVNPSAATTQVGQSPSQSKVVSTAPESILTKEEKDALAALPALTESDNQAVKKNAQTAYNMLEKMVEFYGNTLHDEAAKALKPKLHAIVNAQNVEGQKSPGKTEATKLDFEAGIDALKAYRDRLSNKNDILRSPLLYGDEADNIRKRVEERLEKAGVTSNTSFMRSVMDAIGIKSKLTPEEKAQIEAYGRANKKGTIGTGLKSATREMMENDFADGYTKSWQNRQDRIEKNHEIETKKAERVQNEALQGTRGPNFLSNRLAAEYDSPYGRGAKGVRATINSPEWIKGVDDIAADAARKQSPTTSNRSATGSHLVPDSPQTQKLNASFTQTTKSSSDNDLHRLGMPNDTEKIAFRKDLNESRNARDAFYAAFIRGTDTSPAALLLFNKKLDLELYGKYRSVPGYGKLYDQIRQEVGIKEKALSGADKAKVEKLLSRYYNIDSNTLKLPKNELANTLMAQRKYEEFFSFVPVTDAFKKLERAISALWPNTESKQLKKGRENLEFLLKPGWEGLRPIQRTFNMNLEKAKALQEQIRNSLTDRDLVNQFADIDLNKSDGFTQLMARVKTVFLSSNSGL